MASPPSSAIAVSVLVFLSTLIFFQVATAVAVLSLGHQFSGQVLLYLLRYGFLTCTGIFLFILLSLWMPHRISHAITAITRTLRHSGRRWRVQLARIGERITLAIREYQSSALLFFRKNRMSVLQTFLITSLYYLGKLNLAYLILLGLGVHANYLTAMAILALLRFILYFAPTPGGSGIGEITIAALMSTIMPLYLLPIYIILYRAFHLFLPASFGAYVLLAELRAAAKVSL